MTTSENNITPFALGIKQLTVECVAGDIVFHTAQRMFCGNNSYPCQEHSELVGILGQWIKDGLMTRREARLYHMGLVL
jgi:hypothetical protein